MKTDPKTDDVALPLRSLQLRIHCVPFFDRAPWTVPHPAHPQRPRGYASKSSCLRSGERAEGVWGGFLPQYSTPGGRGASRGSGEWSGFSPRRAGASARRKVLPGRPGASAHAYSRRGPCSAVRRGQYATRTMAPQARVPPHGHEPAPRGRAGRSAVGGEVWEVVTGVDAQVRVDVGALEDGVGGEGRRGAPGAEARQGRLARGMARRGAGRGAILDLPRCSSFCWVGKLTGRRSGTRPRPTAPGRAFAAMSPLAPAAMCAPSTGTSYALVVSPGSRVLRSCVLRPCVP